MATEWSVTMITDNEKTEETKGIMQMRGARKLGGIKRRIKDVGGGGGTPGYYDTLRLDDSAIWLRIHPDQLYEQTVYERDAKAIVEVEYPWVQTEQHWVSSLNFGKGGIIVCTSGPEKDKPCLACDVDSLFWAWRRNFIEAKGFKPEQGSPAGRSTRYTTSVVVVEKFYKVPVTTSDGKQRTSKKGEPVFNDVPGPQLQRARRTGDFVIGKKLHWGFGPANRAQLFDINTQLISKCANCASDLRATGIRCIDCGVVMDFEEPETDWQELAEIRAEINKCEDCGYSGMFDIDYECSNDRCSTPVEGGILAFELQLRMRKGTTNASDLILENFRVPTESDRIQGLLKEPLDIAQIKAPKDLHDNVKSRLNELMTIWKDKVNGVEQGVSYGEAGGADLFEKDKG